MNQRELGPCFMVGAAIEEMAMAQEAANTRRAFTEPLLPGPGKSGFHTRPP